MIVRGTKANKSFGHGWNTPVVTRFHSELQFSKPLSST